MFEVRFHGRGGQGVVTAAELASVAAFLSGRHAQAFPSFGSERTGAPVASFCRIDDRPIRTREPVARPDCVVVADPSLVGVVDMLAGLRPDGYLLVNTTRAVAPGGGIHVCHVSATQIALRLIGRALPNAALLGAFAALTAQLELPAVLAAIRGRFPANVAQLNVAAATQAYEQAQAYQHA